MKKVLIIGMGEFGKHIAYTLAKLKNEVCIIDTNSDIINILSNHFDNAYVGDCMRQETLNELGVANFDICIVAVGQNFQASLEITNHLKELNAKYIIAKAASDIQAKFLKMAGADETVYPEKDIAEKVAVKCNAINLFDYIRISEDYGVFEIKVLKDWVGKSLKELDIRNTYDVNIIAVTNKGIVNIPNADYRFSVDDHVYIFGKETVIRKFK